VNGAAARSAIADASLRQRLLELRSLTRRWEDDLRNPNTTQEQIEQIARELPGIQAELGAIQDALERLTRGESNVIAVDPHPRSEFRPGSYYRGLAESAAVGLSRENRRTLRRVTAHLPTTRRLSLTGAPPLPSVETVRPRSIRAYGRFG